MVHSPSVLTLTLNPALDVSTQAPEVKPTHKLRCDEPVVHPGGGGVNVARVLTRLGCPVLAIHTAGGANGQRLSRLLAEEGVAAQMVPIAEETRESLTVRCGKTGQEFRFVLPGPRLSPQEVEVVVTSLANALEDEAPAHLVVLSGGLAPGVMPSVVAELAEVVRQSGARLVVDSHGPALKAALSAGVFLVKPSLSELQAAHDRVLDTPALQRAAALAWIQAGQAEVVALSLGEAGAMLVTAEQAWLARAPEVKVHSTVGAGDSFLAGLCWAITQGWAWPDALTQAVATGAASVMRAGTELCSVDDILRLRPLVRCHSL